MLTLICIVLLFAVTKSEITTEEISYIGYKDSVNASNVYGDVWESKVLNWAELAYILTGFFSILMMGFAITFYCYSRQMKAKEANNILKLLHGRDTTTEDEDIADPLQIIYDTKWELEKHSFCIDESKILGCGEFGIVYKGTIAKLSIDVAFKSLRSRGNMTHLTSLVSELKLLVYIGKHRNIVEFLGAYTKEIKKGIFYVAMECCTLGSLKSYLRFNKERFLTCPVLISYTENANDLENKICEQDDSSNCTIKCLLQWCSEISKAMDYLYTKKVVHRDLAARNILLTEDLTTKLTDFGLSRRTYTSDEYVRKGEDPLPWKWLALESLLTNIFNVKTDVWAYGITLWEVFSFGESPYPGLSASKEFVTELQNGLRNRKPIYASIELYKVMVACWNCDPDERPTFASLCILFQNAHQLPSSEVNVEDMERMGQLECENIEYLNLEELTATNNSVNDLTKHLISISKTIANLEEILANLIQCEIISDNESRIIKCEMTDSSRSFKLLSLLLKNEWPAVKNIFLDILIATNNAHCIDDIERIPTSLNEQSLTNTEQENSLQENMPSSLNQSSHKNVSRCSNIIGFSNQCICVSVIGIFILLAICTAIFLAKYLMHTEDGSEPKRNLHDEEPHNANVSNPTLNETVYIEENSSLFIDAGSEFTILSTTIVTNTSPNVTQIYSTGNRKPNTSEDCTFPTNLREGMRVKFVGGNKLYLILDGMLRHVPTKETNLRLFKAIPGARTLDQCVLDQLPMGSPIPQGAHLGIGSGGRRTFLVYGGVKRHICNPSVYAAFHFREAKPIPNTESLATGPPICSTATILPSSQ